jgi:nicotinate phosphoribosyltransferase
MLAPVGRALVTDLYELNMAASYLRRGMTAPATFSLFVRDLPSRWGFFVACGLERCLDYLEDLRFTEEDLGYLRETGRFDDGDLAAFAELRFTGDVAAVPEGRMVYPDEPLLEVTAPMPAAQLAETYLLNQVTYQTAIASKAARCTIAAGGRELVDFALRRVHGEEAGMAVARATAIAGFSATSNVEAARALGLRPAGTMAHSYIEAFDAEIDAFRAYAEDRPERVVLLVDTYDTARGVAKAIEVAGEMAAREQPLFGIRLDSGDLGALAREARRMLDAAGFEEVQIFASGGVDEDVIDELRDAPVDAFGVGSRIGVAHGAPYLDSVYKLVEYDGRPVAKLSTAKATLPGRKQVWRRPDGDLLGLRDEPARDGSEPLLVPVMERGERLDRSGWREAHRRFEADLAALPEERRSLDPEAPTIARSGELRALADRIRADIRRREAEGDRPPPGEGD